MIEPKKTNIEAVPDDSIANRIDVVYDVGRPIIDVEKHNKWIERSVEKLQKSFDNDEDLTLHEKIKILQAVSKWVDQRTRSPAFLAYQIEKLPDDKKKLLQSLLQSHGVIDDGKKVGKGSVFA